MAELAFKPPVSLRRYLDEGGRLEDIDDPHTVDMLAFVAISGRYLESPDVRRYVSADTRDMLGRALSGALRLDPDRLVLMNGERQTPEQRIREWAWTAELGVDDMLCYRVERLLPAALRDRELAFVDEELETRAEADDDD